MPMEYLNRQGLILPSAVAWSRLYQDTAYRNVAVDIEDPIMVSTIWDGYEPFVTAGNLPRIFETALLVDGESRQTWRWYTEKEALAGHSHICDQVFKRPAQPEDGWLERIIEAERALEKVRQEAK